MSCNPYGLFIGGFDPSAGAGVLADIKTAEQCGVYGFACVSAITYQQEDCYLGQRWVSSDEIELQLKPLFERYPIGAVKIGLVESSGRLGEIVAMVRRFSSNIPIVLDPVLSASAGYIFHGAWASAEFLELAQLVDVITPNFAECSVLCPSLETEYQNVIPASLTIVRKGKKCGTEIIDSVVTHEKIVDIIRPEIVVEKWSDKHGSGCVFGAALTSRLLHGDDVVSAAKFAGEYVRHLLGSSNTRLGIHREQL